MDPIISPKRFGQVAGIEISKGEPGVVKALQKLWQKLQLLEQAHYVAKADTATQKDEWTLPEVQQRLLELQIQYVRNILRQNNNTDTASVPHGRMDARKETSRKDGIQLSSLHECSDHIPVRDCYDKHTQTDSASAKFTNSLYSDEEITQVGSIKNPKDAVAVKHKKEFMLPGFHGMKTTDGPRVKPQALNVGLKQKNLRTHYHLKLSDVPFIIGTSTSSHSVVANVQKIISMMKVHNKGLCSSAPNLARRSPALDVRKHDGELGYQRTYSTPDLSEHWDLKNILLCLMDELKTLTSKLENMKVPDNLHSSELSKHLHEDYVNTVNLIEMKTKQIAALRKAIRKHSTEVFPCRRRKSFSESTPYSRDSEKLTSASKDVSFMNRISKTEVKHVICSFSDASCRADGSDRRKMMRELKEIQVHLQHEDIHWK